MMIKLIKWLFDIILVGMLFFSIFYSDIREALQRDTSQDEAISLVETVVNETREWIEKLW